MKLGVLASLEESHDYSYPSDGIYDSKEMLILSNIFRWVSLGRMRDSGKHEKRENGCVVCLHNASASRICRANNSKDIFHLESSRFCALQELCIELM